MKTKIQTPSEVLLLEFAIIESKNQRDDEQYNSGNYLRDKVKHYYYLQLKALLIMKTR